jgi:hypothetical protein
MLAGVKAANDRRVEQVRTPDRDPVRCCQAGARSDGSGQIRSADFKIVEIKSKGNSG